MAQRTEAYPVVLRMRGMYPRDLAAYERHRERVCGDNGHCDPKRKDDNRQLLGSNTWAQDTWDKIQDVRHANHERDLNQLRKRRRKKDLELAIFRGPRDPWRPTRHGPMREIILTVNKAWFDEDLIKFFNETGPTREELFEAHAKEWLINNFGDQCVHARADLDETTYHIHAVIVPLYASKGGRQMLQPSLHPLIQDYEKAQDNVGEWFSQIGLRRGERRAQSIREAIAHNRAVRAARDNGEQPSDPEVSVPERRKHVSPREWRARQEMDLAARDVSVKQGERKLADAREALTQEERDVARKNEEAQSVLDVADAVAGGDVDVISEKNEAQPKAAKPSLAQQLFGQAIAVLRQRARREARAELEKEFSEIEAADAALLEIAKTLPQQARQRLAQARRSLIGPLNALRSMAQTQSRKRDRGPDEKS